MRWALAAAVLATITLALVLYWQMFGLTHAGPLRPTLAPGEFDLLLTARAIAAGDYLPLWAGAVHPDAIGTYLGAIEVALLLSLGISGGVALKLCGTLHFALLCGSATGLTARLGGRLAAVPTLAFLLLGAPALLGAHSRFLGTTTEVIGLQVAILWWIIELARREEGRRTLPGIFGCGLLLGTAVVYSSHSLWLVVFCLAFWALEARPGQKLRGCGWLLAAILLAVLPWKAGGGAPGLETAEWTLKSIPVRTIVAGLGFDDLLILAKRLPFALLDTSRMLSDDAPQRWLHAGWMAALCLALCWTLVTRGRACIRGPQRPLDGLLAIYAMGAFAPMLFAGDLAGYPSAYRYSFNAVVVAAVLLGLRYADVHRLLQAHTPRAVRWTVTLLASIAVGLGLWSLPSATTFELTHPEAAFVAGQHRVFLVGQDTHQHFRLLMPTVRDTERKAWLQGYGMLIGEEFDQRQQPGPDAHDQPASLSAQEWLASSRSETSADQSLRDDSFFVGVGLGLALDGWLSRHDVALIRAVPAEKLRGIWFGIGAALGERHYWSGRPPEIQIETGWQALEGALPTRAALWEGYQNIEGLAGYKLDDLLPFADAATPAGGDGEPMGLSLRHPFIYKRLVQVERGEFK